MTPALIPLVAAFALTVVALGALVSFVVNLVRYAGYRVERYADRVVVERGLISRSSRTLAAGRVQYVTVTQGVIRRAIGYAEVSAWVVAAPGEAGGEVVGAHGGPWVVGLEKGGRRVADPPVWVSLGAVAQKMNQPLTPGTGSRTPRGS